MSFMLEIESCRPPAIDRLAVDYLSRWRAAPVPMSFCQRVAEAPQGDRELARRLGVPVAIVRGWRDVGSR